MKKAKCPECDHEGIYLRKDAYVNYKIMIRPDGSTHLKEEDTAEMDHCVFECFHCGAELDEDAVIEHNKIKGSIG